MGFLSRLLTLLVIAAMAFVGWLSWFAFQPVPLRGENVELTVRPGQPLKAVSHHIAEAGVALPPWKFTLLARTLGKAGAIKAGRYEIEASLTPFELLRKLTRGDVTQAAVVLIEGWSFRQLRAALDAHPHLAHDSRGLPEAELLQRIGAKEASPEGLFLPDTYLFPKGYSDLELLQRAYQAMERSLAKAWEMRDPRTPYRTPYEALIMASIVEKETGTAADRGLVASVFVNRLKNRMLLQTDPTVIYGLGDGFDGNLRKNDLLRDGPYNTYTRLGLPPTPIALPGMASLEAALNPPQTAFLYFVARGDGSSHFSRSLDEHNRAVDRYQRRRGS